MADRPQYSQQLREQHPLQKQQRYEGGLMTQGGPTTSQILAVVALLPLGGILLALAGLTLVGSLIGLAVTTPLFIICSPVLVPAAIGIALAVTGFITSGAFGLTALSSISWLLNSFRQQTAGKGPLEYTQGKMQDAAVHLGQKTKDVGQTIQTKAQEGGRGDDQKK